jgi:pimeloyl-[acyl-carrier protein] methyl ester esterase
MPVVERPHGVRLHVEEAGAGPALLLVHGWSLSGAVFAPLAARLAGRLRVIRPDLRGHGRSGGGPVSLEALAGDLAGLVEALAPGGAAVAGWSLGAMVALAAAPALGERLTGLALLGGTPRFTADGAGWPHGLPAREVRGLAARVRRQGATALRRFFDACFAEGELEAGLADRLFAAVVPPRLDAALAGLEVLATADLRGGVGRVTAPALVIHGEADAICPVGAGRALAAALPSARLATLPGAGHACFVSREAEVAELLAGLAGAGR